jgi:hypothetical protein
MHERVPRLLLLGLLGLLWCACSGAPDPGVGGDDDDDPTPDASVPVLECTSETDCGAERPFCTAENVCVQCMTDDDCSSDAPLCSNHACSASCAGEEVSADLVALPSDIIWVVDQSGSMNQETAFVQAKLNDFANLIDASNIDYRVVMIATKSGSNAICVPGPLAGPSCGDNTRFKLVDQRVGSTNGPSLAISQYPNYSSFLRPDAVKHFVFVTDDNSAMSASAFLSGLDALQPAGTFDDRRIHAIYAFGTPPKGCTGPFGTGAAEGTVYTTLVTTTGGARGVICEDDWSQVFADITAAVVAGSQVACDLAIPEPPAGETLDPSKVNVKYLAGGVAPGETLPRVSDVTACSGAGWYYDDNATPTSITLCPDSCTTVQGDVDANVKVVFGCATQLF